MKRKPLFYSGANRKNIRDPGMPSSLAIMFLSLGVGAVGCEFAWGQVVPTRISLAFYLVSLLGLMLTGLASKSNRPATNQAVATILCCWFGVAVICERVIAMLGEGHMPTDGLYKRVLASWMLSIMAMGVAFRLPITSDSIRQTLGRVALVLSWISIGAWILGSPPRESWAEFPALYVGFPVRLLCLFSLCWYVERFLSSRNIVNVNVIGIAASSFATVVAFHKPILFSAIAAVASIFIIHVLRGTAVKSGLRFLVLLIAGGACFAFANLLSSGAIYDEVIKRYYQSYLHATEAEVWSMGGKDLAESAAGGRFELWEIGFQRISETPVFGSGLGQRVNIGLEEIPLHNGYIDILASVGLFGAIPIALGFIVLLRAALDRINSSDADWVSPTISFLVGVAAYNLGGTSILFWNLSAFSALCMGLVIAKRER